VKLTISNGTTWTVDIYNTLGTKGQTVQLANGSADLNLLKGLYIVRVGKLSSKIML